MIIASCVTRRSALATFAVAGMGAACRANSSGGTESALDAVAEQYVRCALQLAQHQPSLVEGWRGPEPWRPGARRPVREIRAQIEEARHMLGTSAGANADRERMAYLQQQLAALGVHARRLAGESTRFIDEARAALGSDVADLLEHQGPQGTDVAPALERARETLARRLPGRGALAERYAAFRVRHALSPERLALALPIVLDAVRRQVRAHLSLPESEGVRVESASAAAYEGNATYDGRYRSSVRIDTSRPVDVVHLCWLVAHETYPGHHVQHVLADRDRVQAKGWPERALFPAFGRHQLCAEGAAEAGAALLFLDDAFDEARRAVAHSAGVSERDLSDLLVVHSAVRELDGAIPAIARSYVDGATGSEVAARQLADALVLDPQPLLLLIERQRTRILAYPVGRRLVWAQVRAAPPSRHWERLAEVSTALVLPQRS